MRPRTTDAVVAILAVIGFIASTAGAGDLERELQGSVSLIAIEIGPGEGSTVNHGNDGSWIAWAFDHDRENPGGDVLCTSVHVKPPGSSPKLTRSRFSGFLATESGDFELAEMSRKWRKLAPAAIDPQLPPDFPDIELTVRTLRRPVVWTRAADGTPLSEIYAGAPGDAVFGQVRTTNKGRLGDGSVFASGCASATESLALPVLRREVESVLLQRLLVDALGRTGRARTGS